MPAAVEKKGPRKSKKGAENPPPPPPINVTVRDCMVWPEPRAKGQGKRNANKDTKPSAYHSTLVHRDDEEAWKTTAPPPPPLPRRDQGTAIEALRGWPGSREQAEEEAHEFELWRETAYPAADAKSGKNSKKKGKKDTSKAEAENVFIGDLIHQRYLNEHMEKRRREMEREQRKKDTSQSMARAGRRAALERSSDIKANRTSQLRAIALAGKVETSPLDLWKMPRFTKAVNPHLATGGGGGAALQGTGRYEGADSGFPGGDVCDGGCYCDYGNANYVDDNELDGPMATN